ncbi:MAG: TolC family protein, partial [Cyclobacteriaceae bacterium]|nr:TolC family protein [Cyclobacteriaceae bacterium]
MSVATRFLLFAIGFLVLAGNDSSAQDTRDSVMYLTLEECIQTALKNNENILIADTEVAVSRAVTGEYLSAGLPQVDITASFNKNFIIRRTFVPANIFDPSAPAGEVIELQFGTPYDGLIGINLNQMIFDGSYFVGLKAAKTFTELSSKQLVREKIDVVESVVKAYFTLLVNMVGQDLILDNYSRLDTLLRETRIMFDNGFAEKIDLNRTQVEFNNISTQLDNSERLIEISINLLKFQMGLPIEQEVKITERLSDLNLKTEDILIMETSYGRRIEYSVLQTNLELQQLDMKNNKVQYLPQLDLVASWGMNAGVLEASSLVEWGDRTVWPDYQLAGLSVYIPIFDGLLKSKKIQQNKLKIKQLNLQRMMLEKNITVEVAEKKNNLISGLKELESQEKNMALAREVYDHTKIKYQEGLGSNL